MRGDHGDIGVVGDQGHCRAAAIVPCNSLKWPTPINALLLDDAAHARGIWLEGRTVPCD